MEIMQEELLEDEDRQEEAAILKESYPLPWEETVREFEQYLLDIGVRI